MTSLTEQKTIVTKSSGDKVVFDENKLKRSLERSGASEPVIEQIVGEIKESLFDGITTKAIYKKAFAMLRKNTTSSAARYKLKKAIMELGPTGYPFEKFVGAILNHQGFTTQVGVIVKGHCVNHEVDVIAEKGNKHFMVECKFHSDPGRNCDVKVPLYINSRFRDIKKQWRKHPEHDRKFHQGWICTNTRFTSDAIQYGNCAGLIMLGWDYPENGSLKEQIDVSGLHPVTCLTTLSKYEKQKLLARNSVLCMDLCDHPEVLNEAGIDALRQRKILNEARDLCKK